MKFGHYRLDRRFINNLPELTFAEMKAVKETWPCFKFSWCDYLWYRILKKYNGFSPYYLIPYHYILLRSKVNPSIQLAALENKAMSDIYFPNMSFPKAYVRCLNSTFYDQTMHHISFEEAVGIVESKSEFVIKPSIGSEQGRGVVKVTDNKIDAKNLLNNAGSNFIVQEVLTQTDEIQRLNPTSLNCFRITSIYMNGNYKSVAALKIGKKGASRDNWNCSYWVNVKECGDLSEIGYDYDLNIVDRTDNGICFSDVRLPFFHKVAEFVEKNHKHFFPNCAVVGWDVTLDKNNDVRVIEVNLVSPGTKIEQLVNGDFFRQFHSDIINVIRK